MSSLRPLQSLFQAQLLRHSWQNILTTHLKPDSLWSAASIVIKMKSRILLPSHSRAEKNTSRYQMSFLWLSSREDKLYEEN